MEVDIKRGETLNDVYDALSAASIHVTSMRNKANRLEQLFVDLTQNPREAS